MQPTTLSLPTTLESLAPDLVTLHQTLSTCTRSCPPCTRPCPPAPDLVHLHQTLSTLHQTLSPRTWCGVWCKNKNRCNSRNLEWDNFYSYLFIHQTPHQVRGDKVWCKVDKVWCRWTRSGARWTRSGARWTKSGAGGQGLVQGDRGWCQGSIRRKWQGFETYGYDMPPTAPRTVLLSPPFHAHPTDAPKHKLPAKSLN